MLKIPYICGMESKKCSRCLNEHPIEEFISPKRKTVSKWCLKCTLKRLHFEDYKKQGILTPRIKDKLCRKEAFSRGNYYCLKCKSEKDLSNFGPQNGKKANEHNIYPYCKECLSNDQRSKKVGEYDNFSDEKYKQMLINQNYECKVCKEEIMYSNKKENKSKTACIDHDHKTGKVRGLLCQTCNRAIGLLKDDINILQRAIDYLASSV